MLYKLFVRSSLVCVCAVLVTPVQHCLQKREEWMGFVIKREEVARRALFFNALISCRIYVDWQICFPALPQYLQVNLPTNKNLCWNWNMQNWEISVMNTNQAKNQLRINYTKSESVSLWGDDRGWGFINHSHFPVASFVLHYSFSQCGLTNDF